MKTYLKKTAKVVLQQTIGRLRPSSSRLTGLLAKDGGKPVRDIRLRPWARRQESNVTQWWFHVRPAFRKIFTGGMEGLPQPLAERFAQRWAKYCGCRYGLLMAHGTDALRFALAAALDHDGLDYGGEVIVPNLSFIASATAALDRRFGIVLVDVEPGTLLLDPLRVEQAIIPGKTRAIMAVHLFGQPANMTALATLAKRHNLKLIEDAAQAHGSVWETGPSGSLGDAAAFSFQSHKNLTCGEGGALTTNDEELFRRAYSLHNVGRSWERNERWDHTSLGWNCRITEYQAALLTARFAVFEQQQETRRRNFYKLRQMLEDVACVKPLDIDPAVRKHGLYMFAMRYKRENCGGLSVQDFLRASGAEGAPIYRGYTSNIARQPAIEKLMSKHPHYFRLMPTPVADAAAEELVYISQEVFLGVEADMADIAAALRKVESHYTQRREVRSSPVAVFSGKATGQSQGTGLIESRYRGR